MGHRSNEPAAVSPGSITRPGKRARQVRRSARRRRPHCGSWQRSRCGCSRRRDDRRRRVVSRSGACRHACAIARTRRRAHGVDRNRGPGRRRRRGDDNGRAAEHRSAGRRRLGRRVPGAPGARGQALEGSHLRSSDKGARGARPNRDGPPFGERRARLYRWRAGGGRCARHAAGSRLCPHLRSPGAATPRRAEPCPRRRSH